MLDEGSSFTWRLNHSCSFSQPRPPPPMTQFLGPKFTVNNNNYLRNRHSKGSQRGNVRVWKRGNWKKGKRRNWNYRRNNNITGFGKIKDNVFNDDDDNSYSYYEVDKDGNLYYPKAVSFNDDEDINRYPPPVSPILSSYYENLVRRVPPVPAAAAADDDHGFHSPDLFAYSPVDRDLQLQLGERGSNANAAEDVGEIIDP